MSRVLILANHYNTLRIFRKDLIRELAARGHDITVSIPPCAEEEREILESYGCRVLFTRMERRGMNPVRDLKLLSDYRKLLQRICPDKVITYTIKPNIYGAYACKRRRIPCYVNVTGLGSAFQSQNRTRRLVSFMYKHSLDRAEVIFFENADNRDVMAADGLVPAERTAVMRGAGVNLEDFPACAYPLPEEPLKFLFIGRIMREKGVDELFEAIRRFKAQNPEAVFSFLGWYEDDYKDTVRQMADDGLLCYYGFQHDVRPFIEKAHCVLLPSWHEGMSNTLLEGAAMCRPLITNRVHGCMEAVIEGKTGYLAEVRDADSLYTQICRFAALPWEEKRQMGLRGRKHMEAVFDKRLVVSETIRYLGL